MTYPSVIRVIKGKNIPYMHIKFQGLIMKYEYFNPSQKMVEFSYIHIKNMSLIITCVIWYPQHLFDHYYEYTTSLNWGKRMDKKTSGLTFNLSQSNWIAWQLKLTKEAHLSKPDILKHDFTFDEPKYLLSY